MNSDRILELDRRALEEVNQYPKRRFAFDAFAAGYAADLLLLFLDPGVSARRSCSVTKLEEGIFYE